MRCGSDPVGGCEPSCLAHLYLCQQIIFWIHHHWCNSNSARARNSRNRSDIYCAHPSLPIENKRIFFGISFAHCENSIEIFGLVSWLIRFKRTWWVFKLWMRCGEQTVAPLLLWINSLPDPASILQWMMQQDCKFQTNSSPKLWVSTKPSKM